LKPSPSLNRRNKKLKLTQPQTKRISYQNLCLAFLSVLAIVAVVAALAINEFRRRGLTSNAPGPATRLTVAVKTPATSHEVQ